MRSFFARQSHCFGRSTEGDQYTRPDPAKHIGHPTQTVLVNGRRRAYLECRRIRRRDYFLLERIGSPFRESYLAFDRLAGPRGSFFMVQSLPAGDTDRQLLRVLSRLKSDNLPRAVEWQEARHQIDVALTWTEGISLADYLQNIREGRRRFFLSLSLVASDCEENPFLPMLAFYSLGEQR